MNYRDLWILQSNSGIQLLPPHMHLLGLAKRAALPTPTWTTGPSQRGSMPFGPGFDHTNWCSPKKWRPSWEMNSWNCYKLLKLPSNGLISGNISKKPWVWPSNTSFTINFPFNHPTSAQSYHRCLVRFRTWSAGVPMWRNPKGRPLDMPVLLLSPCRRSWELRNEGTHIWHTLPPKSHGWSTCVPLNMGH